jgi:hypothetical protein
MALTDETRKIIFDKVKKELEKCSPPMVVSKDKEGVYELMGNKPVPYGYKKVIVPGMYFCSVVARKDMISFYFFPIYIKPDAFNDLAPTLFKTLKGKTCFNIKKAEQVDSKELAALLKKGVETWGKEEYMK